MPKRRACSQRTCQVRPKKQGCKRQKSMRGIPDNPHGELKRNVTVSLTPTAQTGLDELSRERQISRSELLERLGRGWFALVEVSQRTLLEADQETTIPDESISKLLES